MIDLKAKILDKNGEVVKVNIKKWVTKRGKRSEKLRTEELTVGRLVENVLISRGDDCNPDSIYKRYTLWKKLKETNETTKKEEEMIRELCAEKLDVIVVGQIFDSIK